MFKDFIYIKEYFEGLLYSILWAGQHRRVAFMEIIQKQKKVVNKGLIKSNKDILFLLWMNWDDISKANLDGVFLSAILKTLAKKSLNN